MMETLGYGRLRRWLFFVLLLVFVFTPVLVWWGRGAPPARVEDHEEGRRDGARAREPSEPTLHGVDTPSTAPAAPSEAAVREADPSSSLPVVRGVVRSTEGAPLANAQVFLIRKDVADSWGTMTDADGRFDLGPKDPRGRWLGAVCEGHLPAHLDGDDLPPDGECELVLEPGPLVRVRVSDGRRGALALDTTIFVVNEVEGHLTPKPGEIVHVQREVVVPAGQREASVRVGTRSPLRLEARYDHVCPVVEPEEVVLRPPGEAAFTVRPSCVIDVTVVDAETGEPLDRGFGYELLQGGKMVASRSTGAPGGRLPMQYRLKPGTYELQAFALGYRRHPGQTVELADYGDVADVSVRLEADPTVGHLRISIPALSGLPRREAADGTSSAPPARLLWRMGASAWQGTLPGARTRENDTDYLFTYVPEGEIDLLVAEETSDLAAFVAGIRVQGGRTETVVVDLRPGIRFVASSLWSADRWPRVVHVRHPVYGGLPVWALTPSSAYWAEAGTVPGKGLEIGPYPGPAVDVTSVFEGGEEMRSTVRAEED